MTEYDTPPEDLAPPQHLVYQLIGTIAEAHVERDVWDEDAPEIFVVSTARNALGLPSGVVAQLPVPEDLWRMAGHPARALPIIAGVLERTHDAAGLYPQPVQAVAVVTESWELDFPADTTKEQRMEAYDFTQKRGVADHHWAVEAKNVFAMDVDGWQYATSRYRGGGQGRRMTIPPHAADAVTGRIPEGLTKVLAAMR